MPKYIITNKAVEDLVTIWEYTLKNWSENQADKYYSTLLNDFQSIAKNPSLGKKYLETDLPFLSYSSGKHLIFYRILNEKVIEITRILHVSMDLKNRIEE